MKSINDLIEIFKIRSKLKLRERIDILYNQASNMQESPDYRQLKTNEFWVAQMKYRQKYKSDYLPIELAKFRGSYGR
jgi:hypothetical protein